MNEDNVNNEVETNEDEGELFMTVNFYIHEDGGISVKTDYPEDVDLPTLLETIQTGIAGLYETGTIIAQNAGMSFMPEVTEDE